MAFEGIQASRAIVKIVRIEQNWSLTPTLEDEDSDLATNGKKLNASFN